MLPVGGAVRPRPTRASVGRLLPAEWVELGILAMARALSFICVEVKVTQPKVTCGEGISTVTVVCSHPLSSGKHVLHPKREPGPHIREPVPPPRPPELEAQ